MSNGPEREMTLDECLERLPEHHAARKELASLRAEVARYHPALTLPDALGKEAAVELAALRAGVEQWQENKAEVERLRKANAAQAKMLDDMEHTTKEYEALEAEVLRLRAETVPASEVAVVAYELAKCAFMANTVPSLITHVRKQAEVLRRLLACRFETVRMVPVEALEEWGIVSDRAGMPEQEWMAMPEFIAAHAVTVMVRTEGKEDGDGEEH
jgi:hypothetical protein